MFMRVVEISFKVIAVSAVLVSVFWVAPAFACCTEIEARDALRSGDFALAASSAQTPTSIQTRLIAAEALSAQVLLGLAEDGEDAAKEARALSESVLAEDPKNAEAKFQYALADGFITRATPPFTAWRKKLPQRTFETVTDLIAASPEDARAHALLGAWHMGILRKTGAKNGAKWFGAYEDTGRAAYERALELRPSDVIIMSNYALSLAEIDFETHGAAAFDMLQTVIQTPPKDAIEAKVQERMIEVLSLWDNSNAREKRIARRTHNPEVESSSLSLTTN